jgi:hypothetical protein
MIFKPRIFISSTLNENLSIRTKIEKFFSEIGAETMLYEKNLTPAVNAMTYRKDILDADFIIFIIKSQYGKRTDAGISGTHEELQIALDTNIPKHVYIKLNDDESDVKELIDEINDNQISYYYFKDDKYLLKRIKETTFTIAKEIMLKKIEDSQLHKNSVRKICVKYDYEKAIEIIKIIESMKQVSRLTEFDWIESTLFDSFLEPLQLYRDGEKWIFNDGKIEDMLNELLSIYGQFDCHSLDYMCIPSTTRNIKVQILGEIIISRCSVCQDPRLNRNQYKDIIKEFFEKYEEFKEYVKNTKLFADIII